MSVCRSIELTEAAVGKKLGAIIQCLDRGVYADGDPVSSSSAVQLLSSTAKETVLSSLFFERFRSDWPALATSLDADATTSALSSLPRSHSLSL